MTDDLDDQCRSGHPMTDDLDDQCRFEADDLVDHFHFGALISNPGED